MSAEDFPTIRLAVAQAAPVFLDRDATVEKACALVREAGRAGADVVGFPEGFVPGHPVWYYHFPALSERSLAFAERLFCNSVQVPSEATRALCAAAAAARTNVVIGICERRPGSAGTMWNSQLFIDRAGEILGVHQKLVPTAAERLVHAPGSGAGMRAFAMDFGAVGGLICGENSNPLAINALIREQVRVLVASWPNYFAPGWPPGMSETGVLTGRAIAYMAKCFVLNACGTVTADLAEAMAQTDRDRQYLADPSTFGGSTLIAPTGAVIAGPAGHGDEMIYADADLRQIVRSKLVHDLSGHYQRADVFEFRVDPSAPYEGTGSPCDPITPSAEEAATWPNQTDDEAQRDAASGWARDGSDRSALPSPPGA